MPLSPHQMRTMMDISGMTYTQLCRATKISRAQLLRLRGTRWAPAQHQLAACESALLKAVRDRGVEIERLVSGIAA